MNNFPYNVQYNPYPNKGELSVLFAGREQTEPKHNTGPNILDYFLVHYVVSGRGYYYGRGKKYSLDAGDSFFILPGELVQYTADSEEPWHYRWIGFRGTEALRMLSACGVSADNPIVFQNTNKYIAALYHRMMCVLEEGNVNSDLLSSGLLRVLIAKYTINLHKMPDSKLHTSSEIDKKIEQAISILTIQYYQPLSIDLMAHQLGYHRTYFSKMFKATTGLSPMHFLMKIRMEQAKLLLKESLTIEQIASSVGFNDPLYFSRKFKQWFGCPPSEFRANFLIS